MPKHPDFDQDAVHRYYSAACFNQAWKLIEKASRTPEEDETMVQLSMASAWHWSRRPDNTPTTRSISAWQLSRIYVLLGHAEIALRYGNRCLAVSQGADVEPFYLAYAHEAIARAELAAGHLDESQAHLNAARTFAADVTDKEDQDSLLKDLATIQP